MSTFVEHHQKLIHKYPINLKAAFSEIGWARLEHLGSAIVPPYVWHVYAEPEAQWESRTRSMSDD